MGEFMHALTQPSLGQCLSLAGIATFLVYNLLNLGGHTTVEAALMLGGAYSLSAVWGLYGHGSTLWVVLAVIWVLAGAWIGWERWRAVRELRRVNAASPGSTQ